ncbi:hypothetical protein C3L33_15854, partial [Rhododendron williamsianum]
MATAAIETKQQPAPASSMEACSSTRAKQGEGLRQYYLLHIHDLQLQVRQKSHNLSRLEAQRNDLNSKVRMLKEELQLLQEAGSYVGEVVKVMGKSKVLVKEGVEKRLGPRLSWFTVSREVKVGGMIEIVMIYMKAWLSVDVDVYHHILLPLIRFTETEHAPSIIFMDEIDSIGSARMESGSGNGDSEVQRTMLELLNQLDGFEASNKIKVLMATNRIDILDHALLRPGRIDRKIEFPNPNGESRWDILKIHSRRMNLMRGIDLKKIAEKMNGASGAELKAVCTEAGMFALRERRVHVTQEDFEMAVAKVMKKDTEKNMSLRKLWK